MKTTDFKQGLKQVANEMNLTKNIFTAATPEQLEIAANTCVVESYQWENTECHFLIKDGVPKEARLFEFGEEFSHQYDLNDLYEDFKFSGEKQ